MNNRDQDAIQQSRISEQVPADSAHNRVARNGETPQVIEEPTHAGDLPFGEANEQRKEQEKWTEEQVEKAIKLFEEAYPKHKDGAAQKECYIKLMDAGGLLGINELQFEIIYQKIHGVTRATSPPLCESNGQELKVAASDEYNQTVSAGGKVRLAPERVKEVRNAIYLHHRAKAKEKRSGKDQEGCLKNLYEMGFLTGVSHRRFKKIYQDYFKEIQGDKYEAPRRGRVATIRGQ
ncbi:hypothetical protein DW352_05120 [Pseudolabrys taiwanensis]|uniref:Uncharacterized protein n=1 Tax=Pseudolabrys taiwanensis TaxID=331696 RepID=A0A345ZSQ5_9HYPH|nr:hypothetical protein DW352_05120 [Pseudolabrys taiwanensis]